VNVFKNVALARNSVAPEDDLRIETCWSDFKCFNVKFYVCALVGVLIKLFYEVHGATIKIQTNVYLDMLQLYVAPQKSFSCG